MVNKSSSATADVDLGVLLGLAFTAFAERLNAALRDAGFDDLGRWYGYVFRALDAEPLSLTELSIRLDMTSAGAMKIIDEMEARGYVERTRDGTDARVKRLRLAARGRSALAAARKFHRAFERDLGPARAKQLRTALADIAGYDGRGPAPVLRPM
jgi:DNA-binding MarR family transcriptional regulator